MTKTQQPLVSIITINYNEVDATLDLLASLRDIGYTNKEVIVVDNASKVSPQKAIKAEFPEVKLIMSDENLGFAGGNNLGIKEAKGDYLLFINNDAVITEGTIEKLIETFEKNPDAGIVSPKFHFYNKPGIVEYAGYSDMNSFTGRNTTIGSGETDKGQYDQMSVTHFCHGGGMMVPRHVIEKVGPIPEEYFL
ncbi:glycosyltransferase family 2 protein, partial [Fulvivirga sp. RKSG066]|uniref:glycosyltransferase family 2 protein n=1 Tax=Fulvivirga aurantia TaxID=2529383 RepID=UPI0012BB9E8F